MQQFPCSVLQAEQVSPIPASFWEPAEGHLVVQAGASVAHPCGDATGAKAGREAQAGAAHGEVGDEVPDERDELDDGGEQGEDGEVLHARGRSADA